MTMLELQGKRVKLSRSTITMEDENGKTRGMVRNLRRYIDMSFRDQCEHKKSISTLWGNKCGLPLDHLYFDGNQWYYIFHCGYVPPYEMDRYNTKIEVLEKAQENGIKIIRVPSI